MYSEACSPHSGSKDKSCCIFCRWRDCISVACWKEVPQGSVRGPYNWCVFFPKTRRASAPIVFLTVKHAQSFESTSERLFFLVSSFKVASEKQPLNTVQSSVPWSYSWKLLKMIVTLNSALWVNAVCLLAPHMLNWIKLCVLLCLVAETCFSSVYLLKKDRIVAIMKLFFLQVLSSNVPSFDLIIYLTTYWI